MQTITYKQYNTAGIAQIPSSQWKFQANPEFPPTKDNPVGGMVLVVQDTPENRATARLFGFKA